MLYVAINQPGLVEVNMLTSPRLTSFYTQKKYFLHNLFSQAMEIYIVVFEINERKITGLVQHKK